MNIYKNARDFAKNAAGVCVKASKINVRKLAKDFAESSSGVCVAGIGVGVVAFGVAGVSMAIWLINDANLYAGVALLIATNGIQCAVACYGSHVVNASAKSYSYITGCVIGVCAAALFADKILMPQALPAQKEPAKTLEQPAPSCPSQHPGSMPYRGTTDIVKIIPKFPSDLRLSLV